MPPPFSITDLHEAVNRQYPVHGFKRETIRGAFRHYLTRPDCPITIYGSGGQGPKGHRYKRKPETVPLNFSAA